MFARELAGCRDINKMLRNTYLLWRTRHIQCWRQTENGHWALRGEAPLIVVGEAWLFASRHVAAVRAAVLALALARAHPSQLSGMTFAYAAVHQPARCGMRFTAAAGEMTFRPSCARTATGPVSGSRQARGRRRLRSVGPVCRGAGPRRRRWSPPTAVLSANNLAAKDQSHDTKRHVLVDACEAQRLDGVAGFLKDFPAQAGMDVLVQLNARPVGEGAGRPGGAGAGDRHAAKPRCRALSW